MSCDRIALSSAVPRDAEPLEGGAKPPARDGRPSWPNNAMLRGQGVPQDVRARTKLCSGCGMQAGLASDARPVHYNP